MQFSGGEVTAAGALGGLIGGLITHALAIVRDERKIRQTAFDDFCSAITPTLAAFDIRHPNHAGSEADLTVQHRLVQEYSALREAYRLLWLRLPGDRLHLEKAWQEFAQIDPATGEPRLELYKPSTMAHPEEIAMRMQASERLKAIATPPVWKFRVR